MSKGWFFVDYERISDERRKLIASILFVVLIIGYIFVIGFNVFIFTSIFELRLYPTDFQQYNVDNETISIEGELFIENDHWNSVDMFNLRMNYSVYTDNNTYIISDEFKKDIIPRSQNTTLIIKLELKYLDNPQKFLALNQTDYLVISFIFSLFYAFYGIYFEIQFKLEDLV